MNLTELERKYLQHLEAVGRSPATVKTYRSAFRRTWEITAGLGVELDTEKVDESWAEILVEWWIVEENLQPSTIHRNIGALRGLFKFAQKRRWTKNDPFVHLELPEKSEVQRIQLSDEELRAMEDAASRIGSKRCASMVRALFLTQMGIGTRVSELLNLRVSDLNFDQEVVRLRRGKGGKTREVPMGPRMAEALQDWVQVRGKWLSTRTGDQRIVGEEPCSLWLADRGRKLSKAAISRLLDELRDAAGLASTLRVRIHDLRAMTAQRWKRAGVAMETIQNWLGHADLAMTKLYVKDACADTRQYARYCDLPPVHEATHASPVSKPATALNLPPAPHEQPPSNPVPPATATPAPPPNLLEFYQAFLELQQLQQRHAVLQAPGAASLVAQLLQGIPPDVAPTGCQ